MNRMENDIKSKLENFQSLEGIDANGLWNNISNEMVQGEKSKRRFGFFWFSALALLVISSSVFYSLHSEVISLEHQRLTSSHPKPNKGFNSSITFSQLAVNASKDKEGFEVREVAVKSTQNRADINFTNHKKNNTSSEINAQENAEKPIASKDESREPNKSSQAFSSDLTKNQDDHIANEFARSEGENSSPEEVNEFERWSNLNPLIGCPNSKLSFELPKQEIGNELPLEKNKKFTYRVFGGLNYRREFFPVTGEESSLAEDLNRSLSASNGLSLGIEIPIYRRNTLNLSSGIEYHKFSERYDKIIVTDTEVYNESTETFLPAVMTRTIVHHNYIEGVTIPLIIGKTFAYDRFYINTSIGGSYTHVFRQSGKKSIGIDEVDLISQSNKQYSDFVSLRASIIGSLRINERFSLDAGILAAFQQHQAATFINLDHQSLVFLPQIGITFNP